MCSSTRWQMMERCGSESATRSTCLDSIAVSPKVLIFSEESRVPCPTRTSRRTSALEIPAGTPPDWNYKRAQQVLSHLPDALTTNGTVWEIFWNFLRSLHAGATGNRFLQFPA